MTKFILTDERYAMFEQEYDSYSELVRDVEQMCQRNGWHYDQEDYISYRVEE